MAWPTLSPLLFISCQEVSMTVEVWYWPFVALLVLWQTIGWGLILTFPSTAGSWWSQRGKFWKLVITIHIAFEGCEHILFKLVCVCQGFLWFLMVLSILFFMFVDKLDLESPESLSGYVLILFQVVLNCKNGKLSQSLWRYVSKSVCWVLNCGCHYANCCLTCQHFPMDPVI